MKKKALGNKINIHTKKISDKKVVKSKGNIDENENTSKYSVNAHQSWFAIKTNIALSISLYDISSIFKNKRDDDVECYYYVT